MSEFETMFDQKEWYLKNRDRILAYRKEYYLKNIDKLHEKQKEHRLKNKDKINAQNKEYRSKPETKKKDKEYRLKNKDKKKAYDKEWRLKNKDELIVKKKKYWLKIKDKKNPENKKKNRDIRRKVLELLGGKCVHCGFSNPRALQIDHIQNNGAIERKNCKVEQLYRKILKMNKKDWETEYQLLCANCNYIKKFMFEEEQTISKHPSLDSERDGFEVFPDAKEV